jgi:hypothetical protein
MRLERVDTFRWRGQFFRSNVCLDLQEMLADGSVISANARDITPEEREQLVGYLISLAERVRGAT